MASPIEARCEHCGEVFALFELRGDRTGNCPRCGRQLAPDWTAKLLHDTARAEVALRELLASIKGLQSMPTSMRVLPSTVLRPLFEETRWQEELAEAPEVAESELRAIRRFVSDYERALGQATAASDRASRRRRRRLRKLVGARRPGALTGPAQAAS